MYTAAEQEGSAGLYNGSAQVCIELVELNSRSRRIVTGDSKRFDGRRVGTNVHAYCSPAAA